MAKAIRIEIVRADLGLARQAALFKSGKKISYADCFAAALAKLRKAELVTGDRDFKQVEGEVQVLWIG
ncbi:MAG: PIN domain-containing protein [bacterium]